MEKQPLRSYHLSFLRAELRRRSARNPRYSLRAFAAFLRMDPSALSRILAGKQELSAQATASAIRRLQLEDPVRRLFLASVAEEHMNRAATLLARAVDPSDASEAPPLTRSDRGSNPWSLHATDPSGFLAMSPFPTVMMDPEGRFLYANVPGAELAGLLPCDLIGCTAGESGFPAALVAIWDERRAEVLRTRRNVRFEFTLGEEPGRIFEETLVPGFGKADGEIVSILGAIHDITEHRLNFLRQKYLWRATRKLGTTLDYEATLAQVAELAVPELADWSVVHALEDDGSLRPVAVRHRDPVKAAVHLERLLRYPLRRGDPVGPGRAIAEASPVLTAVFGDEQIEALAATRGPDYAREITALGLRSCISAPLVARGSIFGALTLMSENEGRRFGAKDVELLGELAARAAVALANARECSRLRELVSA